MKSLADRYGLSGRVLEWIQQVTTLLRTISGEEIALLFMYQALEYRSGGTGIASRRGLPDGAGYR